MDNENRYVEVFDAREDGQGDKAGVGLHEE